MGFLDNQIHLYRNGLDVAADSRLCWQAPTTSERIQDRRHLKRKLKEFPLAMAWPYLLEYTLTYLKKLIFNQSFVSTWGPRYRGIDDDISKKSLIEVCAKQWMMCVEHCCQELKLLENGTDYIHVSYENLANHPKKYLKQIIGFIGLLDGSKIIQRGVATISAQHIDSWKEHLTDNEFYAVRKITDKTQTKIDSLD